MTETTLLITGFLIFLLFLVQRSEKKARRLVLLLTVLVFLLAREVAIARGDEGMAWSALLIALVVNALFWFLIGRYNPPKSSDEIQVLGMDD